MMAWKLPADDRDFPGDSPERRAAALACAGAFLDPQDVILDYGDYNGDWGDVEHSRAQGCGDVYRFYDSHYPAEELTIVDKPEQGNRHEQSDD